MLEIQSLVARHGYVTALHGIDLQVIDHELLAIIGANGAGKSTLLGFLAGIYPASGGRLLLDGRDITGLSAAARVQAGITLVPERRQLFNSLTVEDNLLLGAYHRRRRDRSRMGMDAAEIMEFFPALQGREKEIAGNLSGGLQQMAAIARGMMARPRILMLDEPSVGLAPMIMREIMELLKKLRDQGTTVVLVEQNARAALRIADRAYVLERGQAVLEGNSAELQRHPRVQQAYLGRQTAPGRNDINSHSTLTRENGLQAAISV